MQRHDSRGRRWEALNFPPSCRLDLEGEGPETAYRRARRWLQTQAQERPGAALLLQLPARERAPRVWSAVLALLGRLRPRVVQEWRPFGPASLAVRLAPPLAIPPPPPPPPERPRYTLHPERWYPREEVPPALRPQLERLAELHRAAAGLGPAALPWLERRAWLDAQRRAFAEDRPLDDVLTDLLTAAEAALHDADD